MLLFPSFIRDLHDLLDPGPGVVDGAVDSCIYGSDHKPIGAAIILIAGNEIIEFGDQKFPPHTKISSHGKQNDKKAHKNGIHPEVKRLSGTGAIEKQSYKSCDSQSNQYDPHYDLRDGKIARKDRYGGLKDGEIHRGKRSFPIDQDNAVDQSNHAPPDKDDAKEEIFFAHQKHDGKRDKNDEHVI